MYSYVEGLTSRLLLHTYRHISQNRCDQYVWWQRCGGKGQCPATHDAAAAAEAEADGLLMLSEAARVLSRGGRLIVVSYEPEAGRQALMQAGGWAVSCEEDENGNYIYDMELMV